jgi:hypothetical protein
MMRKKAKAVNQDNVIGVRLLPGDKERLVRLSIKDERTISRLAARMIHAGLNALEEKENKARR